ncbi:MAG: monovalent cation/H(+) antiporter subunit G [Actinomycetaceae bacterium]|nr:monovalent cation/H(+) antiporter subunit G [Actinomycetaceae bacterium]
MIAVVFSWVGVALIVMGTLFTFVSAIGVLQFSDVFRRQHAAAKPQMAGYLCLAIGLALMMQSLLWTGVLLLAVLLQTLTAPVSAHLLGHAALRLDYLHEVTDE